MRVTLPLRIAPRTPACPGFCVFGDRKSACFDRSCWWRAVSAEPRLPALPRGSDPVGVDGATHRGRTPGRGFERVQMDVPGRQISRDALTGMGWALPIERVQMDCGSGVPGPWEPCPLGSFERVQMTSAFALWEAREPLAHCGSHRQSHAALGSHSAFSAPATEYRLPHTAHHRRAPMPPLK